MCGWATNKRGAALRTDVDHSKHNRDCRDRELLHAVGKDAAAALQRLQEAGACAQERTVGGAAGSPAQPAIQQPQTHSMTRRPWQQPPQRPRLPLTSQQQMNVRDAFAAPVSGPLYGKLKLHSTAAGVLKYGRTLSFLRLGLRRRRRLLTSPSDSSRASPPHTSNSSAKRSAPRTERNTPNVAARAPRSRISRRSTLFCVARHCVQFGKRWIGATFYSWHVRV